MVTRTVTIEGATYTLKPLTRRQMKAITPTTETTMEEVLSISIGQDVSDSLEDAPFYVSKELFREVLDLSTGGKAEKN